jgi:hypothetical protein
MTDLLPLKSFGNVCWTHIEERRLAKPAKSDINLWGEEVVLVEYDDTQEPLLAQIYFSTTRVNE